MKKTIFFLFGVLASGYALDWNQSSIANANETPGEITTNALDTCLKEVNETKDSEQIALVAKFEELKYQSNKGKNLLESVVMECYLKLTLLDEQIRNDIKMGALKNLHDQKFLISFFETIKYQSDAQFNYLLKGATVRKIGDEKYLISVLQDDSILPNTKVNAVVHVKDQEFLVAYFEKIKHQADTQENFVLKGAVLGKIIDENYLKSIIEDTEIRPDVRSNAVTHINDVEFLKAFLGKIIDESNPNANGDFKTILRQKIKSLGGSPIPTPSTPVRPDTSPLGFTCRGLATLTTKISTADAESKRISDIEYSRHAPPGNSLAFKGEADGYRRAIAITKETRNSQEFDRKARAEAQELNDGANRWFRVGDSANGVYYSKKAEALIFAIGKC